MPEGLNSVPDDAKRGKFYKCKMCEFKNIWRTLRRNKHHAQLFVKFGGCHAVKSLDVSFEIRGSSHGGVAEEPSLLRCDDVSLGEQVPEMILRNVGSPIT
jgi:hypothetical protein